MNASGASFCRQLATQLRTQSRAEATRGPTKLGPNQTKRGRWEARLAVARFGSGPSDRRFVVSPPSIGDIVVASGTH